MPGQLYIYNIKSKPFRFQGRMDLFRLYVKFNMKEKALKMAKEIKIMPVKISSPEIYRYKKDANKFITSFNCS